MLTTLIVAISLAISGGITSPSTPAGAASTSAAASASIDYNSGGPPG